MTINCVNDAPRVVEGGKLVSLSTSSAPNYSPFQYASSSCVISSATNTVPAVTGGFTYGEIVSTIFLFLIFAVAFYSFIWFSVNKIKIKQ